MIATASLARTCFSGSAKDWLRLVNDILLPNGSISDTIASLCARLSALILR
ncbi:hypothetical protein GTPT_1783 [Tatumella ptyseos ATCC 33301]|uniref:Uncharacterized protein n=1 Tax=Tatumella ptyseos ATCC 33301 TaxID=1005995 RepID=A0A085JHA4_9GAMM|nr:hypothetical protein GTPT_1783 [Tatumella ptyseos ATCC 33301]